MPTIHFGTGTATLLDQMAAAGGDVIGFDWRVPMDEGWDIVGHDRAVQGNLDPHSAVGPLLQSGRAGGCHFGAGRGPGRPHFQLGPRRRAPTPPWTICAASWTGCTKNGAGRVQLTPVPRGASRHFEQGERGRRGDRGGGDGEGGAHRPRAAESDGGGFGRQPGRDGAGRRRGPEGRGGPRRFSRDGVDGLPARRFAAAAGFPRRGAGAAPRLSLGEPGYDPDRGRALGGGRHCRERGRRPRRRPRG